MCSVIFFQTHLVILKIGFYNLLLILLIPFLLLTAISLWIHFSYLISNFLLSAASYFYDFIIKMFLHLCLLIYFFLMIGIIFHVIKKVNIVF